VFENPTLEEAGPVVGASTEAETRDPGGDENSTDVAATKAKTRGALLSGLKSGALEAAVSKMEEDTAGDDAVEAKGEAEENEFAKEDIKEEKLMYNFYEILYGLVDRKCGVPMPGDNLVCSKARLRMCLRAPGVRETAIQQRKAEQLEAARKREREREREIFRRVCV